MDIINYSLILLISFLGTIIGIILSNIALEEISSITQYLKYLNILLIVIIIAISTYSINIIYSIILSCVIAIMLIIAKNNEGNTWTYASMGALLYLSTINTATENISALYTTILIFIYGASITTIDANDYFKNKINGQITFEQNTKLIKKIIPKYSLYLLVGITFYILTKYIFHIL
jgi:hypothetical protein